MLSTAGYPSKGLARGTRTAESKTPITRAEVEIRSAKQGGSQKTIACSTVDEFLRLMI